MWVITAPFDGDEKNPDNQSHKSKLLKPNHSYTLGRKEKDLNVANKKISHNHCQFIVGDHTIDDTSNPSSVPLLQLVSYLKSKKFTITRSKKATIVQPSEEVELQDGDVIALVQGVNLTVEWKPICVYSPIARGKGSIPIDACAALGIKLMYTQHAKTTHHLISHYVANLSTAASLLSLVCFVKPEWLQEIIRLGNLPTNDKDVDGISLEENFILPDASKYKPAFSPSLLPSQKKVNVWEANEGRLNFFKFCRFVCLHEKIRESDSEVQEAIHRGAGTLENFDVHLGVSKFHRTLTRSHAKEGKKVVVVADVDSMQAAVGKESWQEYVAEAKSFNLEIQPPAQLIKAILEANIRILFPSGSGDADSSNAGPSRNLSPLPDVIPNSIVDEPSMAAEDSGSQAPRKPTRNLVRRVTRSVSREPSLAPTFESETLDEPVPRPRKPLVRRVVTTTPIITGLDDPSSVIDAVPSLPPRNTTPPRDIYDYTAPTPARSTRLKRRVGIAAPDDQLGSMLSGIAETMEEEPPLKKFKALFDASNPDGAESNSLDHADSQTQSDAQSHTLRQMETSSTAILREEEEEATQSAMPMPVTQRGQKRTLESMEDVEMDTGDESMTAATVPPSKRRAMEDVNSIERDDVAPTQSTDKPPSTLVPVTKNHGAPAGKPDTDAAFLKAIASTKRGKKTEDAFDREFNQLRISKPEIATHPDPEEEWGVLAEFGDDSGLRGNFMTVVEMDLYRKDLYQKRSTNHSWDEKSNFKKFKKKVAGILRAKVDVFLNNENDYGTGSGYWKSGNSQAPTQTQNYMFGSQPQFQPNDDIESQGDFSIKPQSRSIDSDSGRKQPSLRNSQKPSSKKGSAASKKAPSKSAKARSTLFLDSDDVYIVKGEDHTSDLEQNKTLQSPSAYPVPSLKQLTQTAKAASKAKTVIPIIVDDDSDNNAIFKGFKGRKGRH